MPPPGRSAALVNRSRDSGAETKKRMNSKVEQNRTASSADIAKYALAIALVAAGVVGFYWFGQWPVALRGLLVIGGLVAGTLVFLTSFKGVQTREFLAESRFELRKVVWPTRQETVTTAIFVTIMMVALSVFFLGIDSVFGTVVNWLLKLA